MNRVNSLQRDRHFIYRCISFVFFVHIFFGLLVLIISPVTADTDSSPDPGPQIGWLYSFEQEGASGVHAITATGDGGAVATGYVTSSSGMSSLFVIKTDRNGKKIWNWTEEGNPYEGYSVIETPDKGFAVVGSSNKIPTYGILLLKLDQFGKKTWSRVFGNGDDCRVNSISATRDGGFIIAGSVYRMVNSSSFVWEMYIIKTDADGMELWSRFSSEMKNDSSNFARQTEDGGYIITGTTASYAGSGGGNAYLLKMNEFGIGEWFASYGNGFENDKMSVIQTADGGYILTGINNSGRIDGDGKDLVLIRTDDLGKEQWGKTLHGTGRNRGNLLIQTAGVITVVYGPLPGSESEKNGGITVLELDLNGKETRNQTFSLGQPLEIQDIASASNEGLFVTGILTDAATLQNGIAIIKILDTSSTTGASVKDRFDLTIIARDAKNAEILGKANVFIDGSLIGSTSEQNGKQILSGVGRGSHSVRIAKTGFRELTRSVDITENLQVSVFLDHSVIVPLQIHGSPEEKVDIVIVASNTSYDCNAKTKITDDEYPRDEQKFVNDVNNTIDNIYLKLDTLTSGFVGLPNDYRQRFNFYYYYDTVNFADAFDGCAGKLPDKFWDNAPFTDVAVIMYPSYKGSYSGSSCEPIGCANGLGAGSGSWMKAPADSSMIFLHESGHIVFGLIDTYCGDTYYVENSPFPNVWDTEKACIKDAESEHWDTSACRQILKPAGSKSNDSCSKNFWKADADPDIMGGGAYSGRFGNASTARIRYILDTINRWQK
jgi:hypothetical protein